LPKIVFADNTFFERLGRTAAGANYGGNEPLSPMAIVAAIINIILGLLGIFFLVQVIIAGYQWMSAAGNEETVNNAKKRLTNSAIGVAIVLAAYIITRFVILNLVNVTTSPY
jgi:TRAP-type C4-dicarboxylate transport system permease small subunit